MRRDSKRGIIELEGEVVDVDRMVPERVIIKSRMGGYVLDGVRQQVARLGLVEGELGVQVVF